MKSFDSGHISTKIKNIQEIEIFKKKNAQEISKTLGNKGQKY